jgi:hypothetical protein
MGRQRDLPVFPSLRQNICWCAQQLRGRWPSPAAAILRIASIFSAEIPVSFNLWTRPCKNMPRLTDDARRPVSRVLSAPQVALECGTTIPLGRASQRASRDQPGRRGGNAPVPCGTAAPIRSCSRWGLPCRPCCQGCGALLPHRFALARGTPCGSCAGGLFSVALSLGSPPPAISRHRIPVEPGLSSDASRHQRPSGRLAGRDMCGTETRVKIENG